MYQEYYDVLRDISAVCNNNPAQYIIVGGDFNIDFMKNNDASCVLKSFLKEETLKCGLFKDGVNINYTYESKINGSKSLIDHFFLSENLYILLKKYYVTHEGDNLYDHSCLNMHLTLEKNC